MEQQPEGNAGDSMMFGLIEQADRIGKSAQNTQRALVAQIEELRQVQEWAEGAALELHKRAESAILEVQKQAGTAIKNLEAERVRVQASQTNLERNAVQAIHDAVEKQSSRIERQIVQALAEPLRDIQRAAAQVRQNVKEMKWFMVCLVFAGGLIAGFLLSYWPIKSKINDMQEQLSRTERSQTALQSPAPVLTPAMPNLHDHKGKTK